MRSIPLINRDASVLVVCAFIMNILFLYLYNEKVYFAITQAHGQIGYHLYHNKGIGMDPLLTEQMNRQMRDQGRLIDYDQLDGQHFKPEEPFPINDTVAYGLLLGLLWKITHSLRFIDVQFLQIIIFSFLMLFYYQLAYLLFGNRSIALCCGFMQLLFFPLVAYNVMPVRDVWAYYGLLMLAYGTLSYLQERISLLAFITCMIFVSLCLWMRPTLAGAVAMMTIYILITARKKKYVTIMIMWGITSILFWLPFMHFNMHNYGCYFVSPAGQSLLEGLGELPNQWGHQLNDEYVNDFISKKYNLSYGTVAFDQAAMHEFKQCVKENPWHYIKTLIYRLPDVLLPGLQWIFYEQSPYAHCANFWEKLGVIFSSGSHFINFCARHLWMRLYLLCAYAGAFLLLRRKKYTTFIFIVFCLLSGLTTYPSHIEYRYIVPFYWISSLLAGFLGHDIIVKRRCFYYTYLYNEGSFMKKCIALGLVLNVGLALGQTSLQKIKETVMLEKMNDSFDQAVASHQVAEERAGLQGAVTDVLATSEHQIQWQFLKGASPSFLTCLKEENLAKLNIDGLADKEKLVSAARYLCAATEAYRQDLRLVIEYLEKQKKSVEEKQ